MEKKKGLSLQTILTIAGIALIYVLAFLLDRIPGVPIMLTTVLRKGAIYSLVAVSMNLLNGFTGLFSLGQAGFMLVGAYTFAAINISSGIRSTVYQYYDPLLKFSLTETLQNALGNTAGTVLGVFVSLLLAGLLAAGLAYLIGLPVLKLKSDYLAIATLGFAEIIRALVQLEAFAPVTNGSQLLRGFPYFSDTFMPFVIVGICIAIVVLLINSTYGRVDFLGEPIVCNHPHGKMKKIYAGEGAERYLDQRVVSYTPDVITKRGIARTFQNIRLFKSMTVFENVLTAMHVRRTSNVFSATFRGNRKEEAAQRAKALELLKAVGLDDVKDELATALPYGKQRRLEIARALATDPKLLLLDEPAAGMNPQETIELTNFIRSVRDEFGLTIFLIEHHMNLVMDISDRIYVIDFGKQIAAGVPAEIQNDQRVIDAYLGVDEDA